MSLGEAESSCPEPPWPQTSSQVSAAGLRRREDAKGPASGPSPSLPPKSHPLTGQLCALLVSQLEPESLVPSGCELSWGAQVGVACAGRLRTQRLSDYRPLYGPGHLEDDILSCPRKDCSSIQGSSPSLLPRTSPSWAASGARGCFWVSRAKPQTSP